jgi:hypothetical protein
MNEREHYTSEDIKDEEFINRIGEQEFKSKCGLCSAENVLVKQIVDKHICRRCRLKEYDEIKKREMKKW